MPRVISSQIAQQVEQLLRQGVAQKRVARRLGICVTTVNRIATGRWCAGRHTEPVVMGDPALARRCRGCGGKVYLWPCLYCEMQGQRAVG